MLSQSPLLVVILFIGLLWGEQFIVVDHSVAQLSPRLMTFQFTDLPPTTQSIPALLYAVDAFRLPTTLNTNFSVASFTFSAIRTHSDRDPESLTLVLFYSDNTTTSCIKPAATPFFMKRVNAPGNPPAWPSTNISELQINVSRGEPSALDASVIFDLGNTSLLPRDTVLWVGFYATGARNFNFTSNTYNCLYWLFGQEATPAATLNTTSFHFLDVSNLLHRNLTTWTNASETLHRLNYRTNATVMAWTLRLVSATESSIFEYLARMGTKEIVIVVFASLAGVIIVCVCTCWCVRKCRLVLRRRRERVARPVENLSATHYAPIYSTSSPDVTTGDVEMHAVWSSNEDLPVDRQSSSSHNNAVNFDDIAVTPTTTKKSGIKDHLSALQKGTKFI